MSFETRSIRVSLTDSFNNIRVVGATVKTTVGDASTGISRQTKTSDANGYVFIEEVKNGASVIFGHPISLEISKTGYRNYTTTKTWEDKGLDHIVWDIFLVPLNLPNPVIRIDKFFIEPAQVKTTDRINITATIIDAATGKGAVGYGYTMTATSPKGKKTELVPPDAKVFFSDGNVSLQGIEVSSLNGGTEDVGQWIVRISVADDSKQRDFLLKDPTIPEFKHAHVASATLITLHEFGFLDIGDRVIREDSIRNNTALQQGGIDIKDAFGRIIKHHVLQLRVDAHAQFNDTHSFTLTVLQNQGVIMSKTFDLIGREIADFDKRGESFESDHFKPVNITLENGIDNYAIVLKDNTTGDLEDKIVFTVENVRDGGNPEKPDFLKMLTDFILGNVLGIPNIVIVGGVVLLAGLLLSKQGQSATNVIIGKVKGLLP